MRDQLLSMNLDCEGLDSTGSETEKRIRLLEHFYPTRDEALSQAPVAGVSRYTVDQVKSLLVEPLRSISTELGLSILNSETNAKLTKPVLRDQLIGFIQSQGQNENPVTLDFDFSRKGAILKRIPQASRVQVCILLTTVISNLVANVNDIEVWKIFFSFAKDILGNPNRGGKKSKSLASIIKKRVAHFGNGSQSDNPKPTKNKKPPDLKKQVSEKISQFDVKGAIRLISSNDKVLPPTQEIYEKLCDKHPVRHPGSNLPDPPGDMSSMVIGREDVKKAIKSFKNGSAGGLDGLMPKHIKDLTGINGSQSALNLLDALVDFINKFILPGKVAEFVQPIFFEIR